MTIRVGAAEEFFDYLVLALPFDTLDECSRKLPNHPICARTTHFKSSPIAGIHLWFDRQITNLDHAVLLDRTIQWMFNKSQLLATRAATVGAEAEGSYIELVVSASKNLIDKSRTELLIWL